MQPHFESYSEAVSGCATSQEMERSIHRWLEDKLGLMQLRQNTVSSLKTISVKTNIISDPRKLPQDSLDNAQLNAAEWAWKKNLYQNRLITKLFFTIF